MGLFPILARFVIEGSCDNKGILSLLTIIPAKLPSEGPEHSSALGELRYSHHLFSDPLWHSQHFFSFSLHT